MVLIKELRENLHQGLKYISYRNSPILLNKSIFFAAIVHASSLRHCQSPKYKQRLTTVLNFHHSKIEEKKFWLDIYFIERTHMKGVFFHVANDFQQLQCQSSKVERLN